MSPHVTEAEFLATIMETARVNGWKVMHFHDSRRQVGGKHVGDADAKGWPDLVLAKGSRILFREIKTDHGGVLKEQRAWLNALTLADLDAGIWRPRDWAEIEVTLSQT